MKKSFKNICGKSQIVIFGINFANSRPLEAGEFCHQFARYIFHAILITSRINYHANFQSEI